MCVFFIVCAGTADKWEGVKYIFYKDLDFKKERRRNGMFCLFFFLLLHLTKKVKQIG